MAELGDRRLLFGRRLIVQVHDLKVDGLDVSFSITKSLAPKTPNSAEIKVYNLSANNRKRLQELEKVFVSLEAGYEATGTAVLFRGELRDVNSAMESNRDWITTITSDSGRTARKRRIAQSIAPGTSVTSVLQTAAQAMGLRLGNTAAATVARKLDGTGAAQFFNGYTLAGALGDEVDRLARSSGLEWSIQDDELQFLDRGAPLQQEAVLLTPQTGLVGSVERGNKGVTEVRCLLIPELRPGRRVKVESALVTGIYRIETAKYRGGTAEREWYADLQLKSEERKPKKT